MNLHDATKSIEEKLYDEDSKMTSEEAEVLKTNFDNEQARYFYAIGLLMNSSCRFHYISGFKGFDSLQLEAFDLLQKGVDNNSPIACFLLAEVKCGLFGKFPMKPDEAQELYKKYFDITKDDKIKEKVINNWDSFLEERTKKFKDLQLIEIYRSINPQNVDTSGHDEAYYESLDNENKE